jgi:hypothetical protein
VDADDGGKSSVGLFGVQRPPRQILVVLPNKFPAHMTSIVHDPVHRAYIWWDHSIHPERLRVDRSRRGEALQDFKAVAGMLSGQTHRLGVCGFKRRVFDSRVRSANAEDVVVWFHGNSKDGEQVVRRNRYQRLSRLGFGVCGRWYLRVHIDVRLK